MEYKDNAYECHMIPDESEKRTIKEELLVLTLGNIEPNKYYVVRFYEKELRDGPEEYYTARVVVEEAAFEGIKLRKE